MKPLEKLINPQEDGFLLVKEWLEDAVNPVEILPYDKSRAEKVLYETQVTTRSPMSAIIYKTGGILIDHGWLRILGSGSDKLNRNTARNKMKKIITFILLLLGILKKFYPNPDFRKAKRLLNINPYKKSLELFLEGGSFEKCLFLESCTCINIPISNNWKHYCTDPRIQIILINKKWVQENVNNLWIE